MDIVDDTTIQAAVRQAALIQLKQNVENRWKKNNFAVSSKANIVVISEQEKTTIRNFLMPGLNWFT